MRDNSESNPDILESRYRSKRNQTNLNIELGLVQKQSFNSGSNAANSGGGGGAVSGTGVLTTITGGTSPGGLCFLGDVMIDLFNGAEIRIDRITKEFTIFNFDENDRPCEDEITEVHKRTVFEYVLVGFGDGRFTRVLPQHRYKTPSGEYMPIEDLFNCRIIDRDGEEVPVVHLERIEAPDGVDVYTLSCKNNDNYIANGHRVKNRKREIFLDG
jgi:hypothetical protein